MAASQLPNLFRAVPAIGLSHRIVMAPLTRLRGTERFAPGPEALQYYEQRATPGGLLITEACPISPETVYEHAPGIYTSEQESGWTQIVQAVQAKGGKISLQMWHVGRMSHESWSRHPFLTSLGRPTGPVSSSAVAVSGYARDPEGKKLPYTAPRALTEEETEVRVVEDYRLAAAAAKRCGFDFVEIHAAHGYLLDQFLCDGVNKRTDKFGTQTFENRVRLLGLVLRAVIGELGRERVGIRISPVYKDTFAYQGSTDSDPESLYPKVVGWLDQFKLAYLLLSEPRWNGGRDNTDPRRDTTYSLPIRHTWARQIYSGFLIGSSSFTPTSAEQAIADGHYDAIAFGRFFISNPDFVERVRVDAPLNIYDVTTFYSKGARGFVDYPDLAGTIPNASQYPVIKASEIGSIATSKL